MIDVFNVLVRVVYLFAGGTPDRTAPGGDHFNELRVKEKQEFERIVDGENRRIEPGHLMHRNCPSCGANAYVLFFRTQDFCDYARCTLCGFVYAPQVLTFESRSRLYGALTGRGVTEVCCDPGEVEQDWRRFELPLRLILKYQREGNLLDVGCGVGNFLARARNCGYKVRGIETYVEFKEAAKQAFNVDVDIGLFEEMDLPEDGFQVVTLWETLEHIYDPRSALRQASRILSPNGILAVSVPNLANLGFLLLREYSSHRGGEHINFFSPSTLSRMLNDCGFRVVELRTTGNSNWQDLTNLIDLNLERIYCFENIGKKKLNMPPDPFLSREEAFFWSRIVVPLVAGWEQRTGKGSGIVAIAKKNASSGPV